MKVPFNSASREVKSSPVRESPTSMMSRPRLAVSEQNFSGEKSASMRLDPDGSHRYCTLRLTAFAGAPMSHCPQNPREEEDA